jgi:hypothetical protein
MDVGVEVAAALALLGCGLTRVPHVEVGQQLLAALEHL